MLRGTTTLVVLPVCAITAVSLLAGCSGEVAISGGGPANFTDPASLTADQTALMIIDDVFGDTTVDDDSLGKVFGGFNTGSDMVVTFSFEQATYVNHNLVQSIVIPTMAVSPGSSATSIANGFSAGAIAPIDDTMHTQLSSPAQTVQSVASNGLTSLVSNLSKSGITNVISNTGNNQLIQQMISANIGITGLSQVLQQGAASSVVSRVAAANSLFR